MQNFFRKELNHDLSGLQIRQHCKKNGSIHSGKQKHMCRECGRNFVEDPQNERISVETKELAGRLLPERIPPAGIAGAVGVSERRLQNYANGKYENVPKTVTASRKGV